MNTISAEEFKKRYGTTGLAKMQTTTPPVKEGIGKTISNAFKSGIEQTKQGYMQGVNAKNPLELLESGAKTGAGIVNTVFSPLAPIFKPVEKGINYATDKISDVPAVQKFSQTPLGQGVARGAEDIANVATIAGAVAGIKGAPKVAGAVGDVASGVAKGVKPVVAGAGRTLKGAGESAYGVTVTSSEMTNRAMASFKEKSPNLLSRIKGEVTGTTKGKPITEANTAARYGLIGTEKEIGVQAGRYMNKLWTEKVAPRLSGVKGKLDMNKFFAEVQKEIINKNPELGRRNALIEGLNALKSEYGKVNKVGLTKLQEYKEGWAKTLPESMYKGKPIASALKEVKAIAAAKAREFIYKNAGEDIKQDYIDYGNLKSIRESGIKSGVGDPAKKSISRGAWQFVMDKAITPVATTMGKILYKTGEGLEFIGEPGAKTVGDIIAPK